MDRQGRFLLICGLWVRFPPGSPDFLKNFPISQPDRTVDNLTDNLPRENRVHLDRGIGLQRRQDVAVVAGAAAFLDAQSIDPTVAAVANVNPASITNAAVAIPSSGTSGANAVTDIKALVRAFVAANPNVATAVIGLSPANAMALAATGNYKDLTIHGGFIAGVPALTSAAAGAN
jgi:hypothetical protein